MAGESKTTTDRETIRRWVGERDGIPATVRGTEDDDGVGILRIDFPGGDDETELEHISWDEWFEKFDEQDLAFVYQDAKASGEGSTFFKLVSADE